MITIIYSTHKDRSYNHDFKQHLIKSVGLKNVQILEYENKNEYSLSQIYNRGIGESIHNIVVCLHNDVKLENNWGLKLLRDFEMNPDYGIIGKAGSCYFPESGIYWERMNLTMVGQVYHHPEGQNKWLSKYSAKLPFLIPVVTIDGLFIAFDKTKIKHKFDETIGRFHFYDHSFCVPNYLDEVKIGVTSSFEITHKSVGQPNQEFFESKEKFLQKWGSKLPLDLKPESVYVPNIQGKLIKNIGKIAVIIPTKGKVEMLYECVKSFYDNCSSELFDVFIADTGSSKDEIQLIKEKILPLGNVKLIEYDYYNFAKVNNDVVKNNIGDQYEFILFSNNDIKILNNVIYGMVKIFKENGKTGTVGARLHFADNTVQHAGVFAGLNKDNRFLFGHLGFNSYYNYNIGSKSVIGNTGGLLMIRKKIFEKLGMFNEEYQTCLEDVELNFNCIVNGLENTIDGSLVAYHYESQTRKEDPEDQVKMSNDFNNFLMPYLSKNITKLNKHLLSL